MRLVTLLLRALCLMVFARFLRLGKRVQWGLCYYQCNEGRFFRSVLSIPFVSGRRCRGAVRAEALRAEARTIRDGDLIKARRVHLMVCIIRRAIFGLATSFSLTSAGLGLLEIR